MNFLYLKAHSIYTLWIGIRYIHKVSKVKEVGRKTDYPSIKKVTQIEKNVQKMSICTIKPEGLGADVYQLQEINMQHFLLKISNKNKITFNHIFLHTITLHLWIVNILSSIYCSTKLTERSPRNSSKIIASELTKLIVLEIYF